jgi:hypothetical protein
MRNLVRIFLAAALVAALMPPAAAYAVSYETDVDYFTGCSNLTAAGDAIQDCTGSWSYYGSQTGDWKRVMRINCNTDMVVSILYYENCGTPSSPVWVGVDYSNFGHGCLC